MMNRWQLLPAWSKHDILLWMSPGCRKLKLLRVHQFFRVGSLSGMKSALFCPVMKVKISGFSANQRPLIKLFRHMENQWPASLLIPHSSPFLQAERLLHLQRALGQITKSRFLRSSLSIYGRMETAEVISSSLTPPCPGQPFPPPLK